MKDAPKILIVKKKIPAHGHHGGSWKVAYADFVTALMAFFLVMWILSMDQSVREEIQSYFKDPFSTSTSKAGISETAAGGKSPLASGLAGAMKGEAWREPVPDERLPAFQQLEEALRREIAGRPDLSRLGKHVAIKVTDSGLRIDLIEAEDNLFFASASAELPPAAHRLLSWLGRELGRLGRPVVLEGHTDAMVYSGRAGYSNWELSIDRANAVRRALEASGLQPRQMAGIRGFADGKPRDPRHPNHFSNRRVCILVNFTGDTPDRSASGAPATSGSHDGEAEAPFSIDVKPRKALDLDSVTP